MDVKNLVDKVDKIGGFMKFLGEWLGSFKQAYTNAFGADSKTTQTVETTLKTQTTDNEAEAE